MASRSHPFTVSGPEGERPSPGLGSALSLALTMAARLDGEGTYYVRDQDNIGHYRVERDADRIITVHGGGGHG